jgi:hypothetical protein
MEKNTIKNRFNLFMAQKKGQAKGNSMDNLILVVIILILVAQLAPTALVGLFNATAFTGVPSWVSSTLGLLGVVAFIYLIWRVAKGGK